MATLRRETRVPPQGPEQRARPSGPRERAAGPLAGTRGPGGVGVRFPGPAPSGRRPRGPARPGGEEGPGGGCRRAGPPRAPPTPCKGRGDPCGARSRCSPPAGTPRLSWASKVRSRHRPQRPPRPDGAGVWELQNP
ncbi:proline-rich proteoglycan 2-like [Muntiacus reevesi]|uniref:proline-rich proteoglycan 2-like n=1 Tax=Muntiacus reevesi TaxID=9886 RepID=UPI0033075A61